MANDTSRLQRAPAPVPLNSLRDVALQRDAAGDTGSGVDGLFRQTFDSQREQWADRQQSERAAGRGSSDEQRKPVAAQGNASAARHERREPISTRDTDARKPAARSETTVRKPSPSATRQAARKDDSEATKGSDSSVSASGADQQASRRLQADTAKTPDAQTPVTETNQQTQATADDNATVVVQAAAGGDTGSPAIVVVAAELSQAGLTTDAAVATAASSAGVTTTPMMTPAKASDDSAQQATALLNSLEALDDAQDVSDVEGLQQILARLEQGISAVPTASADETSAAMGDIGQTLNDASQEAGSVMQGDALPTQDDALPAQGDALPIEVMTVVDAQDAAVVADGASSSIPSSALTGNDKSVSGASEQHAFFKANNFMASQMQVQWLQAGQAKTEQSSSTSSSELLASAVAGVGSSPEGDLAMASQSGGQPTGGDGEQADGQTQEQVRLAQWQLRTGESLGGLGKEVDLAFERVGAARDTRGADTASGPIVTDVRSLMMQREVETRQLQAAAPVVAGDPLVPGRPGFAQAMGERIMMLMTQKVSAADIVLDPRELGPVEVKIRQDKDQTTLMFASHHPAVREQLEASLPKLRDLFSQAGLSLGNVSVGDRQAGNQGGQQGGQERWQGVDAQDVQDAGPSTPASRKPRSERAVDFFA